MLAHLTQTQKHFKFNRSYMLKSIFAIIRLLSVASVLSATNAVVSADTLGQITLHIAQSNVDTDQPAGNSSQNDKEDDPFSSGLVTPRLDLPKATLDFLNAQLCERKDSVSACEKKVLNLNRKFGKSQEPSVQLGYLFILAENYAMLSATNLLMGFNIQTMQLSHCPHSYEIHGTVAIYDAKNRIVYLKNPYTRVSGFPDPTMPLPEGYDIKSLPPGMIREGWSHHYLAVVDHPAPRPRLKEGMGYEFSGACYPGQEKQLDSGLVARFYLTRPDKKTEAARKQVADCKAQSAKYEQLKNEAIAKFNELKSSLAPQTGPSN